MYIVSRENGIILNFDNVAEIYTGNNGDAVVAKLTDGKILFLQSYENAKEARTAVGMIAEEMRLKGMAYIPAPETVKACIANSSPVKSRLSGGRKQKGYGGS